MPPEEGFGVTSLDAGNKVGGQQKAGVKAGLAQLLGDDRRLRGR